MNAVNHNTPQARSVAWVSIGPVAAPKKNRRARPLNLNAADDQTVYPPTVHDFNGNAADHARGKIWVVAYDGRIRKYYILESTLGRRSDLEASRAAGEDAICDGDILGKASSFPVWILTLQQIASSPVSITQSEITTL
ncbi:MAG: hypothetical protein ACRYFU_15150 [Janthinobacterium lividum]